MTVTSGSDTYKLYSGDGTTHVFAYTFRVFQNTELLVLIRNNTTGATYIASDAARSGSYDPDTHVGGEGLNTAYILSGVDDPNGGNVTFKYDTNNPSDENYSTTDYRPQTGESVIIIRVPAVSQETNYVPGGAFPAESHEDALDKLTFHVQRIEDQLNKTIQRPEADTGAVGSSIDSSLSVLPDNEDMKGKYLSFNATTGAPEAGATATDVVLSSSAQTLTNKSINADNNTISNIEVDNLKASAVVTEAEGIQSNDNDTSLPTSAAVKDYVDSQATGETLNVDTDGGNFALTIDSETLTFDGGAGITTSSSGTTVQIDIDASVVTLNDTQTLTNKSIDASQLTGTIDDARIPVAATDSAGLMSAADKTKMDGIETGATADQTAAEIKTAYESNSDTNAFTDADHTKLDGIEASADVTDTANVTAAGALMDSEVTNLAQVKAFDSADYATAAQGTTADAALPRTGGTMTGNIVMSASETVDGRDLSVDGAKLDGIESGATADQSASEILTAIKTVDGAASGLDADLLDGQEGSYYTGYTDTAVANLVDSAPATLDTLNELAAALGDDANFSTTVTNSIATKLPLAGGTMTGNIVMSGTETVDGRDLSVDGAKLDGIESGATADQTATEIRTLVESATDSNVFTDADHTKLNGIEASADVTDTANVTAAGALMDSEVTNLADVKSFDPADYATAAQGTTADAALPKAGGQMTGNITFSGSQTVDGRDLSADGTKLDGIEAGATADQTKADIDALGIDAATLDSLDSTSFLRSDAADSFTGQIDGTTIELAGGVTYDPPGSGGSDTATDVGLALHSGARVVMGESGYIRTIIDATASQPLQFGQSGTGYFAGSEIYGGSQGVKLFYNTSSKLQTLTGGVSVTGDITVSGTVDGRDVAADGTKLDGIEAGADVTDATNVNAAGAAIFSTTPTANITDGTSGQVLTTNGSGGLSFTTVSGGGGISNVVEDTTPQLGGDLDTNGNDINFGDNDKAIFGAGPDLQIYHDGSNSYISETGTGILYINSSAGGWIRVGSGNETSAYFKGNGAAELYYDNAKKLETTSGGVTVSGTGDSGPAIKLVSDDPSDAADFAAEGQIQFFAENSASESHEFAAIKMTTADITDGTEDGRLTFNVSSNGSLFQSHQMSTQILFLMHDQHYIQWQNTRGTNFDINLNTATPTADRTITLPDATGTVALTSDIPTVGTIASQAADSVDIDGGAIDGVTLGTNTAITEAQIDNINIDGFAIDGQSASFGMVLKANGQFVARIQSSSQSAGGGLYLYQNNPYITFEGDSADGFETNLKVTDPTADRDITLPDATGTVPVFSTAPTSAITDGTNGQVLTTDGSGGLSFTDGPGVPSTGGTFTGDVTITNDLSVGGSVSLTGGGELVFNNGEGITNSKIQVFKQNYFSPNGLDPGEYIELVSITPTNFNLSSHRQFDITGKIVAQSENSSSAIDVNIRIGLNGIGTFDNTDITYTTTQDADWIEPVLWVNSSTDTVKLLIKAKAQPSGKSGDIDHLTADLTLVRDLNSSTITWNTTVDPADITSITTGYTETVGKKTIVTISDGAVELYHNDSKKLETTSTGASVTGELDVEGDIDFEGALVEKAYNLTGTALDPSNGTLQYKTLSANTTFTESFSDGESITLMINDGTAYTVTWPTMTWASGSAPTLATSGYTTVVLWHQGGLYGAVVS